MTHHTDAERAEFEDGAWYWVEIEGWIGDPPTIAPACYKAECDAWYSFAFSGISTRDVKVLEPCRRAPAAPVPQGWKLVPVDPNSEMLKAAWKHGIDDEAPDPYYAYKAMLAAAPQPPDAAQSNSLEFGGIKTEATP